MELFIAISLPIVLLFGLTFLFLSDGIPSWVQHFDRNSSTLWNFGIVAMTTMALITLIIILGLIATFYYLKNLKTLISNIFPWLVKNKK